MRRFFSFLRGIFCVALAGCHVGPDCAIVKVYNKEGVLQQTHYAKQDASAWRVVIQDGNGVSFYTPEGHYKNVIVTSGTIVTETIPCGKVP